MKRLLYIFFVLFLINSNSSVAQITLPCVDSARASISYPCPNAEYKPVCGCDGKTYRNDCDARYRHGINSFTDGTCSGFEFDILPNFVTNDNYITFSLVQNIVYPATLNIIDAYGKQMYYRTLAASEFYDYQGQKKIDIQISEIISWQVGAYIMFVYNGKGSYRFQKFVKVGY